MTASVSQKTLAISRKPVGQLELDPDNPRLVSVSSGSSQEELIKAMWNEMAVSEVALSIAANGFFKEEPLFVIPKNPKEKDPAKQRFIVVEGNRRLTAVFLLLDEGLRRRVKATDLPSINETRRKELQELPVSIYNNKEELWEYFGFRHVNGPKEWDSFSKAAYVAKVRRDYGISLDEIARKIGDQHSTVKRIYRGYVLLEQAEKMAGFNRDDRVRNRFYFSHLYTAADYTEFLEFLGTNEKDSLKDNPVPKKHLSDLKELMVWLFGSKADGKEPVVQKQAPDLGHLRSVISNRQALSALRSGRSLDRAYAISLGDSRRFQDALAAAKDALQEAKGTVTTGFKGEKDLFSDMEAIEQLVGSIAQEMRLIAEVQRKK